MSDAVATQTGAAGQLANVVEQAGFYTSLQLATQKDKLKMLNIISNSTSLQDKVGEKVLIKDVIIQTAQFVSEETGEVDEGLRVTLIDPDGNAFHAASKGLALSLRTAFNVVGQPNEWDEPLEVTVREGRKGKYRYLTLDFSA